jgi:hypothetical protein
MLFDCPEIAGNAVGKAKRSVVMAKICLFLNVNVTHPVTYIAPMLLPATRQQLHPSEPCPHTLIVVELQGTLLEMQKGE